MATQKIKCRACGLGGLLSTTGGSSKLLVDSAKQTHLCNYFKQQPMSIARKLGALDCRDFREAVNQPAQHDSSALPSLDQPEIGAVVAEEAAPEKVSTENSPRSRRSRRTEVTEIDAGSPKAKAARRPSKKSTKPRKIHSDVPAVGDGPSLVS